MRDFGYRALSSTTPAPSINIRGGQRLAMAASVEYISLQCCSGFPFKKLRADPLSDILEVRFLNSAEPHWWEIPSRLSHRSHRSHSNHTSHSNYMSHTSHMTATTEQIQALSLLKHECTTSILAYTKHARSLAHGVKQGAGHELLSNEQLDAIDTLSNCREDEVRTLLERPHASRKSSIHLTPLHSQPHRAE